jgi:hypothetical protein
MVIASAVLSRTASDELTSPAAAQSALSAGVHVQGSMRCTFFSQCFK